MNAVVLRVPADRHAFALNHLLGAGDGIEQAAFFFVRVENDAGAIVLTHVDDYFVRADEFVVQGAYYIELRDEVRAKIIKRAHDLGAAVVEAHSHPFNASATFSASDLSGLDELAPHMLWRLPGRPYTALVFGPDTFDALCWAEKGGAPRGITHLVAGDTTMAPTNNTLHGLEGKNVYSY